MDKWEIEKKIAIYSMKNPQFKKKLLAHPKAALLELFAKEKGFDKSLLDKIHIVVHQEKKDEFHISLPFVNEGSSLSDYELEKVAGGSGCENWDTCHNTA